MDINVYVNRAWNSQGLTGRTFIEEPELVVEVGDEVVKLPLSDLFNAWEDYQQKLKEGS